jgi:hypothetical protein
LATDRGRFPSVGDLLNWIVAAGFERVSWQVTERVRQTLVGNDVLADPFLPKQATSQLALLSDEAYELGLERIHQAIAAAESAGSVARFQVDLSFMMLTAIAPAEE